SSVDTLYPPGQYAAFLTNHDQNRLMNDLGRDVNKAKVAADMLMTQPGVPFVYYGEEIGMQGAKPDEQIRTPMQWDTTPMTAGFTSGTPWEALQNDTATVNVATEDSDPNSLLNHYRDLIHLRAAHPALEEGKLIAVTSVSHNVYSFVRQSDTETLLVVINLSNAAVGDYGLTLKQGLNAGEQGSLIEGTDALTQPQIDANGGFSNYLPLAQLPPDSLTIIQFK
ncbi:MAG TPA: alpha-amylase family glycosyl hydrolase, partial [Phototrophicaceae bacterium]|nr:alpha-amylase family glycosyl hydrolase [Phototrophicaceae bacterium]